MVKYAEQLAEKLNADKEIVQIAAWLHDIGSIKGHYNEHHIKGAEIAEEFLKELSYPKEKIEKVKHCILTHRASKNIPKETAEAEVISSADSMPHFDSHGFTSLFNLALNIKKLNVTEARTFVKEKLQRMYNKMLPEAKTMVGEKI